MKKLLLLSSVCFSTIMLWAAATPQCNVRVNNEQDGRFVILRDGVLYDAFGRQMR